MPPEGLFTSTMYITNGSQLAVRAMKDGVLDLTRLSMPISGAPSDPLNDDPEPETQRYFVETVWERNRWNSEIVDP